MGKIAQKKPASSQITMKRPASSQAPVKKKATDYKDKKAKKDHKDKKAKKAENNKDKKAKEGDDEINYRGILSCTNIDLEQYEFWNKLGGLDCFILEGRLPESTPRPRVRGSQYWGMQYDMKVTWFETRESVEDGVVEHIRFAQWVPPSVFRKVRAKIGR